MLGLVDLQSKPACGILGVLRQKSVVSLIGILIPGRGPKVLKTEGKIIITCVYIIYTVDYIVCLYTHLYVHICLYMNLRYVAVRLLFHAFKRVLGMFRRQAYQAVTSSQFWAVKWGRRKTGTLHLLLFVIRCVCLPCNI